MNNPGSYRNIAIAIAVIVLAIAAYAVLTMPDRRTTGDKISDAMHQLEDRTPGQKLGDAIKDNTAPPHDQ